MPSHDSLAPVSQSKLKTFYQLGLEQGCPRDQLLAFANAGIILQAKQLAASAAARFCDKPDGPKAVGYGGARGGGKTHWLFAQMGADDCQRLPGLKCLLLRKVGKSNLENVEALRQRLFHLLPHDFNASRGILKFANESQIRLGHYQCEKDIDTYLGLEYDLIGIEEATQLTARKYEDISTCCRTSKPNWRPRIYTTTNPGGVGHQWYHDKFIVPFECRTETDTRFIQALVHDNAFINPDYKASLASRTGWQYAAWYQGQWNISLGQYFRNFHPETHILPNDFKESTATEWFASMDFGYTHLTVVLLACLDDQKNLYVLDEHAERFWIPQQHAQAIKAMLAHHHVYSTRDHLRESVLAQYPDCCREREAIWKNGHRRMLSRFVAGSDIFSTESNGESIAQQYRNLGLSMGAANMDRVSGWSAILDRLGGPGAKPSLFFHPRCKHLIECLSCLQQDPDRPGDILKTNINEDGVGGDDAADALRYLVATKPVTCCVRKLTGF
jgi:phage terminase large subunit